MVSLLDVVSMNLAPNNNNSKYHILPINESARVNIIAIVGNPPYQKNSDDNKRSMPIYNLFMNCAFRVANIAILVTPARFLFNAGATPKHWNDAMLNNEHFRVISYMQDSTLIFPNVKIAGGVAITEFNNDNHFEPIIFFMRNEYLSHIVKQLKSHNAYAGGAFANIVMQQGLYQFSNDFFVNFPCAESNLVNGTKRKIVNNTIEKFSEAFSEKQKETDVGIYCRFQNNRTVKFIDEKYVQTNDFIASYNVLVSEANSSNDSGTPILTPFISYPKYCHTDTFLSIGKFATRAEASSCMKYLMTKFVRVLLGIMKITQHTSRKVWRFVPLQDFTSGSDIDWNKSVEEIDQQLYKKYGLGKEEIDYIENHA